MHQHSRLFRSFLVPAALAVMALGPVLTASATEAVPAVAGATKMKASNTVRVLPPGGLLDGSVRFEARLTTASGDGVGGRQIVMTTALGQSCSATTNDNGFGRCTLRLDGLIGTVLGLGYDASFAGDGVLLPSSDHAKIAQIGGARGEAPSESEASVVAEEDLTSSVVATSMKASDTVRVLPPGGLLGGSLRFEGRLTTLGGSGVSGRQIVMTTVLGQSCSATTNDNGIGRCTLRLDGLIGTVLGLDYTATFVGDSDFLPAQDRAKIVQIGGAR